MMRYVTVMIVMTLIAMTIGCAPSKYRFREIEAYHQPMPFKEATMYPGVSVKNDVAVAAVISDEDTQNRMFSYEIDSLGVVPVMVTVTNNSNRPVLALVNETRLVTGGSIHPPADVQTLVNKAQSKTRGGEIAMMVAMPMTFFIASGEIRNDLQTIDEAKTIGIYNRVLREKVLAPGQTVVGYIFFDEGAVSGGESTLKMDIQKLDLVDYYSIEARISG